MTEFWTTVRFMLYPVMLVCGLCWAILLLHRYRQARYAEVAWAAWLGVAVAIQGGAGFMSLLVSHFYGFGPLTSAIFTTGPLAVTVVVASGVIALARTAWTRE